MHRKCLAKYHDGWMSCSDDTCAHRTRNVVCDAFVDADREEMGIKCPVQGCAGRMSTEYTSEMLYLQMLYLKSLFDLQAEERMIAIENATRSQRNASLLLMPRMAPEQRRELETLCEDCCEFLKESSYNTVDLGSLFNFCSDSRE